MDNKKRLIDAYTFAEEIESLQITVAGKPARWNDAKHSVLRIIAEQPTIDAVEVVHGRWITERTPVETEFECSECGFLLIDADSHAKMEYNYCPNCGAKMDGDGNDEH